MIYCESAKMYAEKLKDSDIKGKETKEIWADYVAWCIKRDYHYSELNFFTRTVNKTKGFYSKRKRVGKKLLSVYEKVGAEDES